MVRPAILALSTALACLSDAGTASAQCRLCSTPTTVSEETRGGDKVALDVETSLNFDQLVVDGRGGGTATIRPDGSTENDGAVADVSHRAMVGTVVLHGQAGRAIRVDMPARILLHSLGGGEISFDEVVTDLPSLPRLDSTGTLTFRFGGRLRVTGDAEGQYRGDLLITAEYL
ncbi:DUF4402 domain-containing protein [Sphingomonas sp.]|uniref:DUF4402 domain-containing protein n=1 Tax=Sphingomonas sp. TaxID=28214 RepID=UPI0025CE4762|nr:DUF4402 domain-containing protein [Sphingomonas sp.]MBV9527535.1 DUF4402 domain-containing protein [Sphingomonas sp.]